VSNGLKSADTAKSPSRSVLFAEARNKIMNTNPLPAIDPEFTAQYLRAAKLKQLNPLWAKLEIVLGLVAATGGLILLRDRAANEMLCGGLIVLGLYLAAAGHRSHLYQSQNRQTAYLAQLIQKTD